MKRNKEPSETIVWLNSPVEFSKSEVRNIEQMLNTAYLRG
jgi:hypothetical protein